MATCEGDCNDADASRFPGNAEVCDGVDNDCDGTLPADELDADADGFAACEGDCDDSNPGAFPGNTETLCNSLDDDCDPATLDFVDSDSDGSCDTADLCTGDDTTGDSDADGTCDDLDLCFGADATGDADLDGFCADSDCNDLDGTRYPGAPELCDGLDNDCDGVTPADELDTDGDGFSTCGGDLSLIHI